MRRQELGGCPLTCPTDREPLERNKDIFPDKSTERKILSLIIKCPSEGCEWTGELREKEVRILGLLQFCLNSSPHCEASTSRLYLSPHHSRGLIVMLRPDYTLGPLIHPQHFEYITP
ncbi:unnamed protein product [Porites lobata]|uniref:Uncharacterized protein n=1 Tax=Porites lobata TaxID=104759 RepID=A0ABN8NXX9_9CNID|nr:unnamed protein product [Porites lobata]